ncbi:alpha/beta hydrolase [Amycolatopsis sp.]|uniref:alpha/beta hydrolase n=1 Tax=Amycolatopsis sp. TaxID=37632 RepID=UPI002C6572FB|nr:alpha/beta hydrolase-fold protein [Amycolatopsis sp.]HVV12582.1 alpha/beta hydrolase-fold protein [Amycolatopsis sp.]
MNTLAELSLTDWWPARIVLLAVTVLCGLLAWRLRRRGVRIVAAGLTILLGCADIAAGVNAEYGYYLTVGQAIGLPGRDASSLGALNRQTVPPAGQVISIDIPGRDSAFAARPAQVYLPPAWFSRPRPKLPVILLLHGTPGSPTDWLDGGGAASTLDAWAAAHHGTAPIVVMPDINGSFDGDTECAGATETYLDKDVPDFVEARFFTQPPGSHWAVAGLSEGGSCAVTLVLRHSKEFATFGDYSGLLGPRTGDDNAIGDTVPVLFSGSLADFHGHEPSWLLTHQRFTGVGGWFEVGDADGAPLAAARQLQPLAAAAGMDARLTIVPGGDHSFFLWRQAFADSLPWLAGRLGL